MKQEVDNVDRNPGESVGNITIKTEKKNICYDCGVEITDRFLLKAGVSEVWHPQCLRCSHCYTKLQAFGTCFLRGRDVYCRECYSSQFDRSCAGCCRVIGPSDWVRRAKNHVYHLACFACDHCKRQLSTGEEFAMIGHHIRCRSHFHDTGKGGEQTSCESK
ncbi:LIM/homeobox protein Lhx6 [Holothuria leucospilota]|uniref:LIM/homeobox protein Lhx6 n=1 Tax=Holothuria leucospilota TaxID=206669 RepID=A0A9Q1C732_HOLLE|nr:LIM/homeobox protein Lhx6 [Holothuria leucospilota]